MIFATDECVAYLNKIIRSDMTVLEFGGGESTRWFIDRVAKVYTFASFTTIARSLLTEASEDVGMMKKWRLYFVGCDWDIDHRGRRSEMSPEDKLIPENEKVELEQDFAIDVLDSIDLILINGPIRYKTLLRAVKVFERLGTGTLVVNNTEVPWREEYVSRVVPSQWRRIDFAQADPPEHTRNIDQNGKWITSVWVI